eukprot:COSAG01_NODE_610_length_14860_cov_222.563647_2_plen_115_part_00
METALLPRYLPSTVTSRCNDVLTALNDLRTQGRGSGKGMVHQDLDADITVIETWMQNLNEGQGAGFTVATIVLSKSLLAQIASKLAVYGAVAVRLLSSLQSQLDESNTTGSSNA